MFEKYRFERSVFEKFYMYIRLKSSLYYFFKYLSAFEQKLCFINVYNSFGPDICTQTDRQMTFED